MNFTPPKITTRFHRSRKMVWNTTGGCLLVSFLFLLCSCGSSRKINTNILYFQRDLDSMANVQVKENIIKVNDVLNIQVFTKSLLQDQAALFNLPDKNVAVGIDGNIEMPLLGIVRAAGLTKIQLQTALEEKLGNYIKSPTVLVKLGLFNINILGEVRAPGAHNFQTETVTILDAISAAGDLTDVGKREDVTVIREENMVRKIYKLDLRSGTLFTSPAYQMQPNDIIYVGANVKKLRSLNTSPDKVNGLQLTASILSIVTTVTFLVYFYKNNK